MKTTVEQNCTIEHDGKTFEAGGAFVSDNYVIGYMGDKMGTLKTWHGDLITNNVKVTSQWRINSFYSSHMYQIRANIQGKWFTGRTMGDGMIARLRPCK